MFYLYILGLIPLIWFLRSPIKRFLTPKPIPGIPCYEDAWPLLGDIPRFRQLMKKVPISTICFDEVSKDLGPICQVRMGPFLNILIVTDHKAIEAILTKQAHSFDRAIITQKTFEVIMPKAHITIPTNETFKHHRRIIGPAMTSKYLALGVPKENVAIADLIQLWRGKMDRVGVDRAWPAGEDLAGLTSDAISMIAFGQAWGISTTSSGQLDRSFIDENGAIDFKIELPPMAASTLFGNLHLYAIRLHPVYRKHRGRLDKFLDSKIAESRAKTESMGADTAVEIADNTLDMMIAKQMRGEDWMSDEEMRNELLLYLAAGTETSSTTLAWALKYFTKHPEVQHKLRAHVFERVPGIADAPPTFEDVRATKLPYLEAVVHECLRLSRTAGGFARDCIKDVTINGVFIPKGTFIVMTTGNSWDDTAPGPEVDSERKVGYWAEGTAHVFNPERWLDASGEFNLDAGPSTPFSGGTRGCMGKSLALLTLRLVVAQLNQAFFFAPIPENQNSFEAYESITIHPKQSYIRPVSWDSREAQVTG